MIDVGHLRAELSALKIGAKPKRYNDPPSGFTISGGYLFTCCIENGRTVLGVSHAVKQPTDILPEDVIISVFGEPESRWIAHYPSRGETKLFTFRKEP